MSEIIEIVQSLGLNAAVLGASMWYVYYTFNKHREDMHEQREMYQHLLTEEQERHSDEMKAMTEAVNNNTLALTKLYEAFQGGEDHVG